MGRVVISGLLVISLAMIVVFESQRWKEHGLREQGYVSVDEIPSFRVEQYPNCTKVSSIIIATRNGLIRPPAHDGECLIVFDGHVIRSLFAVPHGWKARPPESEYLLHDYRSGR